MSAGAGRLEGSTDTHKHPTTQNPTHTTPGGLAFLVSCLVSFFFFRRFGGRGLPEGHLELQLLPLRPARLRPAERRCRACVFRRSVNIRVYLTIRSPSLGHT